MENEMCSKLSVSETIAEREAEAAGEDRGEAEGAAGDGAQIQYGEGERGERHCQVKPSVVSLHSFGKNEGTEKDILNWIFKKKFFFYV